MARLPGNNQLTDARGKPLFTLHHINLLKDGEKRQLYGSLVPKRLLSLAEIDPDTLAGRDGEDNLQIVAPDGLGLARIVVRRSVTDPDALFFLEIIDTQFRQMELAFCIINNIDSQRFDVDRDAQGRATEFGTRGRNIPEEIRALQAGLFPNQTHRGLRMFTEFFSKFERFVDSLGMEVIVAEPLSYDNALRYERLGFDYVTGRTFMEAIDDGFRPGNRYHRRLDDSSPFRRRGFERTIHGRSWAIYDGILAEPWDGITIYRQVGKPAANNSFHPVDEALDNP